MIVDGLTWLPDGQALLSGPLLALARRLEVRFTHGWDAEELRAPAVIAADDLARVNWLPSFPHLATFAAPFEPDEDNLAAVAGGAHGRLAPPAGVLTPAACFHVYGHARGRCFEQAHRFTLQATCFRREPEYLPLERQWTFTMREVVCVGTAGEVRAFLDEARAAAERVAADLDLAVTWQAATDPFFRPASNPGHVMQVVDPTKHELVFGGVALASINLHHDHFGRAFDLRTPEGPAHTGCLAFGLERWLGAIVRHHGPDPSAWPS